MALGIAGDIPKSTSRRDFRPPHRRGLKGSIYVPPTCSALAEKPPETEQSQILKKLRG